MGSFWAAAAAGDIDGAVDFVCPEYQDDFRTQLGEPDSEADFTIDTDKSKYLGTTTDGGARSLHYDLAVTLNDGTAAELDYKAVLRSSGGDTLLCGRQFKQK